MSIGWRSHQACTRMARADYCSSGRTHTREGTLIQIYDNVGVAPPPPHQFSGVQNWPPPSGEMYFEAAWNDGAHPASCLSRRRWQSLPIGPLCDHEDLQDPREDTGVQFCEDIKWDPNAATGALLFNTSRYTDLALHIWKCSDTDLVSTVRGFYQLPEVIQPFPRMGTCTHLPIRDGIILREKRDNTDPNYIELQLYRSDRDAVVASAATAPSGFQPGNTPFEGYAYAVQTGSLVPFNLYLHDNGDYLSTTTTPDPAYKLVGLIGYVLPPETK